MDARQLLTCLPEIDDMAMNPRREQTRQQLPPFQTLLDTVDRRERQEERAIQEFDPRVFLDCYSTKELRRV